MDVRLLVARAKADAKQIALGPETLIGRSPECNLRIASGQVSRKHCLIKVEDTQVTVRDLGSANGTRLNGQTIKTEVDMPIPPGSTLVVGPLKFIVQFTAPRLGEDTELLTGSAVSESSKLEELQRMATAPVADGEETKDYPPSRTRKRGVPPPLVVNGELANTGNTEEPDREARPIQGRSTEADFDGLPSETIFDNFGEAGREGEPRPRVGGETDFLFEEDDLRQLAETIEAESTAGAVIEEPHAPPIVPVAPDPAAAEESPARPKGWGLMGMLRRKKKPARPGPGPSSAGPDDDTDDALSNFLKDQ
jgi:pSer/pThr/pTyr-binding forkhead associated (FHA) protein